jgi:hypothetical protein
VGSENVVVVDDIEGGGFWLVEEEAHAQTVVAEPDPLLGEAESAEETKGEEIHFSLSRPEDWMNEEGEDLLFEGDGRRGYIRFWGYKTY